MKLIFIDGDGFITISTDLGVDIDFKNVSLKIQKHRQIKKTKKTNHEEKRYNVLNS